MEPCGLWAVYVSASIPSVAGLFQRKRRRLNNDYSSSACIVDSLPAVNICSKTKRISLRNITIIVILSFFFLIQRNSHHTHSPKFLCITLLPVNLNRPESVSDLLLLPLSKDKRVSGCMCVPSISRHHNLLSWASVWGPSSRMCEKNQNPRRVAHNTSHSLTGCVCRARENKTLQTADTEQRQQGAPSSSLSQTYYILSSSKASSLAPPPSFTTSLTFYGDDMHTFFLLTLSSYSRIPTKAVRYLTKHP